MRLNRWHSYSESGSNLARRQFGSNQAEHFGLAVGQGHNVMQNRALINQRWLILRPQFVMVFMGFTSLFTLIFSIMENHDFSDNNLTVSL